VSESATFAIVIPTYNEERNIGRLLRSIRNQTDSSYSIVIVDQGSTDRTSEIAGSFGCNVIEIPKPRFYSPPARSRNVGAQSIEGRVLLHLDADMELGSPDFLYKLESVIDSTHLAAIIPERDVAAGFWAKCKAVERECYRGTEMEGARAVSRELFFEVGGYEEGISSGEDFLITRLFERHTLLARDDSVLLLHHVGQTSIISMLKKKFAYGRTAKSYLIRARAVGAKSGRSIAWTSLRAYMRNWRLLGHDPAHYIGIFPLRAMEFGALQLGMRFGSRMAPEPTSDQARHPT
jgi:glycosyltransferase involved in cell wall biosynthesis